MSEPNSSADTPDGEQSPQEDQAPRHKRKKRPYLLRLARALFFAARVLWWWMVERD